MVAGFVSNDADDVASAYQFRRDAAAEPGDFTCDQSVPVENDRALELTQKFPRLQH
jgi:hypothetical protein